VKNKSLQQIKNFKYLSFEIFYENEKDIKQKLAKFAQILGNTNTFKANFVHKFSGIKVYNALSYGSKISLPFCIFIMSILIISCHVCIGPCPTSLAAETLYE